MCAFNQKCRLWSTFSKWCFTCQAITLHMLPCGWIILVESIFHSQLTSLTSGEGWTCDRFIAFRKSNVGRSTNCTVHITHRSTYICAWRRVKDFFNTHFRDVLSLIFWRFMKKKRRYRLFLIFFWLIRRLTCGRKRPQQSHLKNSY